MLSPRIKTRILALASLALLALASIIYTGCAKGITGNPYVNSPPQVRFVNVPPDGSSFSANPILSWVGSDIDGRVVEFHYTVALRSDIPGLPATPGPAFDSVARAFAETIPASNWTIRQVTLDDPANKDTVRMSADFNDPVNSYVNQLVFLRAVDDKGAVSEIQSRNFSRNDHYPQTGINPFVSPYVNVKQQRFGFGGIPIVWSGTDEIDFPGDVLAPLEFEWKLFGPYTKIESLTIIDSFTTPLLVTSERTYEIGDTLIDTLFDFTRADTVIDSSATPYDTQISVHIDQIYNIPVELANELQLSEVGASFDTVVSIQKLEDTSFTNDRLVESSFNPLTGDSWVTNRSEVFFDVYAKDPLGVVGTDADTTREMSFLFWVRARDDAFVPDPTPTFAMFTVILPRHERDLLVVDFAKLTFTQNINGTYISPPCWKPPPLVNPDGIILAKNTYAEFVNNWIPGSVGESSAFGFDTATFEPCGEDSGTIPLDSKIPCSHPQYDPLSSSPDYMLGSGLPAGFQPFRPSLRDILKHKVVLLVKEHVQSTLPVKRGTSGEIWLIEGALSGVNFWTMSRAVFQPTAFSRDTTFEYGIENQSVPEVYAEVFGVRGGYWQGWYGAAVSRRDNKVRNEDFIGAVPVEGLSPAEFPELVVDTFLLRTKLRWSDPIECGSGIFKSYPYMDSIGALPEVGFTIPNRLAGTESLYLYRSRFGEAKYPFFDLDFNDYQGTVVAVRRDAGFFRNSHWVFTPMALGPTEFQKSFNTMLDWLFAEPWGGPTMGVSARRTPASEELDYTSEALRLAQYGEQRRVEKLHEIMGGQRWIKNQFEFDAKYRQWKAEKRALEMAEEATF